MSTEANKDTVRSFYAAAARGDLETCFSLLDDEVVWHNIGSTRYSGTFRGKEALVSELLDPLFAALKAGIASEIVELTAEDDRVVAETRGRAETVDGKPYNNTYCQVFRIRDGRIVAVTEYMDTDLIVKVLG